MNDSIQTIRQEGESYVYIAIRLEFIEEIRQLCEDSNYQIVNVQERRKAIADCTFERMSLLNIDFGSLVDVQNQLCSQNPATLTPDQLQVFNTVCAPELMP